MAGLLLPPQLQFVDHDGKPLAGGQLFTYIPGTSTVKTCFQDADETIFWTNPIVLDDRGAAQVFGDGDYRFILEDADGNQIFDTTTSEPLPANVVSSIMLPLLGAQSLQQFRDLAGITAAIQAAVSTVSLIQGPTGPAGVAGPIGPTGPTGAAGASGAGGTGASIGNPGWWTDTATGFTLMFGMVSTDGRGHANIGFPKPFNSVVGVLATSALCWADVSGITNSGCTVDTKSPLAGGDWSFGPIGVYWLAIGSAT